MDVDKSVLSFYYSKLDMVHSLSSRFLPRDNKMNTVESRVHLADTYIT